MLLLDTNAYSALALQKESIVCMLPRDGQFALCATVIAELRTGFKLGTKERENNQRLTSFLSTSIVLAIDLDTTEYYAEIATFARQHGWSLSNNDLWIAALSLQYDAKLLTYDKDFAALSDCLGDQLVLLSD